MGSSSLLYSYYITPNTSIQPAQYSDKSYLADEFLDLVWIIVPSFFLVICGIALVIKNSRHYLEMMDLFVDGHLQEIGVPVVYKKTLTGGIFTLNFYFFTIISIVAAAFAYGFTNIYEIRALVPNVTLKNEIVSDIIEVNYTLYMYGDKCANSSDVLNQIYIYEDGIKYSKRYFESKKILQNCYVYTKYTKVSLTSKKAEIFLKMKEELSYAMAISVSVSSNSSIPNEISGLTTSIKSPSNMYAFRGVYSSEFYFKFIPSVYFI